MKINREPIDIAKSLTLQDILELGYDITIEGGDDYEDGSENWHCSLYLGDSNSPWKTGTISGEGFGKTIKDSFQTALGNLETVIGYTKIKPLPVRSSFSVFLADWKARMSR